MDRQTLFCKCAWTLCGGILISWAFLLYGYSDSYTYLTAVEVLLGITGLLLIVGYWTIQNSLRLKQLEILTLCLTLLGFLVWCWIQIRIAPSYGTDEVAFDQYAAQLFMHGHNPYTASMVPSFNLFHVSPNGYTFRLNGTPVTQLSYPSLSFLVYLPLLSLGITAQAGIIMNCLAWCVAITTAFFLLPRTLRPLALLFSCLSVYTGFAVGGVTDALYIPLLLVATYKWDSFNKLEGWMTWRAPVFMGLALGIKQTPWLVFAFLLAAIYLDNYHVEKQVQASLSAAWKYAWRTLVIFILPNLYFMFISLHAWVHGMLTPLEGNIVPAGQGWIGLSNFLGIGGGNLQLYSLLGLSLLALIFSLAIWTYPLLKPVMVFLPSIVLFFTQRSFANYLVMLLLPLLTTATSLTYRNNETPEQERRFRFIALPVLLFSGLLGFSLFVTQPLTLRIQSVQTTGQLATVVRVNVLVTNLTKKSMHLIFASESGGAISAPWNVIHGPKRLNSNLTATYQISAPNFFAQPQLTSGFQIVALTENPNAMNVSRTFSPTNWHTELVPQAINKPVVIGVPKTIKVQVVNSLNQPIYQSGVPVYMGQIIYAQSGIQFSQAVINGSNVGQTPVMAVTNSLGTATFSITGTQSTVDPVYFEANLVNQDLHYPYGYSPILAIQFVSSK